MGWWIAVLKPGNKAPYLTRCRDEEEAEEREDAADAQGLTSKIYHTGTDNIYEAKQMLRKRVANDFGYNAAYSNYGVEDED